MQKQCGALQLHAERVLLHAPAQAPWRWSMASGGRAAAAPAASVTAVTSTLKTTGQHAAAPMQPFQLCPALLSAAWAWPFLALYLVAGAPSPCRQQLAWQAVRQGARCYP